MISRATRDQPSPAAPVRMAQTTTTSSTSTATATVTGASRVGRGCLSTEDTGSSAGLAGLAHRVRDRAHQVDDPRPPARGEVVVERYDIAGLHGLQRLPARPR